MRPGRRISGRAERKVLGSAFTGSFLRTWPWGWRHWFNVSALANGTFAGWPGAEFSTVDTALLAAGALFAQSYFGLSRRGPRGAVQDACAPTVGGGLAHGPPW